MPETDLEQHAINGNFLQPNFRTKIPAILPMGDNLDYHKMTFYGFTVYLSIITSKQNFG